MARLFMLDGDLFVKWRSVFRYSRGGGRVLVRRITRDNGWTRDSPFLEREKAAKGGDTDSRTGGFVPQ